MRLYPIHIRVYLSFVRLGQSCPPSHTVLLSFTDGDACLKLRVRMGKLPHLQSRLFLDMWILRAHSMNARTKSLSSPSCMNSSIGVIRVEQRRDIPFPVVKVLYSP